MNRRSNLLIVFLLMMTQVVSAQKLTVESMTVATNDISASQYERKDLNGQPCALVKVQLLLQGAMFEGNVIQPVEYKTNEYWVYMTAGSKELHVKHPNYQTLVVTFPDYGIKSLQSLSTYRLSITIPQAAAATQTQKQKLIINYSPATATVLIDSKFYKGSGHIEVMLPVGSHDYIIAADGYVTAEGSVKLAADAPRTVTESLPKIVTILSPKDSFAISPIYVAKYAFECIKNRDEKGFCSCLVEFDDELQYILGSYNIIHEAQNSLKEVFREGFPDMTIDYNMYNDFLLQNNRLLDNSETIEFKGKEYKFLVFEAHFVKEKGKALSSDLRFIQNSNGMWKMSIPLVRRHSD